MRPDATYRVEERPTAVSQLRPYEPYEARAPRRKFLHGWPWEIRLFALAMIYVVPPVALALAAAMTYYTLTIPDPMAMRAKARAPVVRVLARDGAVLSERGGEGAYVPVDLLPRHLVDAVVAAEDRRFFKHWGLDPTGLMRAAFANLRAGRVAQGGSTLTQQLAKNLFLGPERTLARKLEELVLALWLETRLGKRDILELYLNRVYFGAGAYGVEMAARRFFGKSAREVTVLEAAALASLLKAPSRYSPASNQEVIRVARRRACWQRWWMRACSPPRMAPRPAVPTCALPTRCYRAQSGVDYAVDAALDRLPPLAISADSDIVIETTVDGSLQRRDPDAGSSRARGRRRERHARARPASCSWIRTAASAPSSAAAPMPRASSTARSRPSASRARPSRCSSTSRRSKAA